MQAPTDDDITRSALPSVQRVKPSSSRASPHQPSQSPGLSSEISNRCSPCNNVRLSTETPSCGTMGDAQRETIRTADDPEGKGKWNRLLSTTIGRIRSPCTT